MSSQQTNGAELDTILATGSSAPSESLAASVPPELFKNVLAYVGDEDLLVNRDIFDTTSPNHVSAIAARRDEMRHLSACTLTCVYWAQLTRQHLFERLILRSSKDIPSFLSLLRAPQSPRIPPMCSIIYLLYVFYTLGDQPWFHNLTGLLSRYRISNLVWLNLYITGPATPLFVAASTQGSMLHPLFFATPRVLPIIFPESCDFFLSLMNIHLPNPTLLFNLFQDCSSLRPILTCCVNLTWDLDPAIQATPSLIGLKYACHTSNGYSHDVSGCTDNVLVATMLKSVPHHEASQRRRGPYLDPLETSYLFDAMRTTWCGLSPELQQAGEFEISSNSKPESIQSNIAVRLSAGTDFYLTWKVKDFEFRCITSRLPHIPATSNNVRIINYIIINLWFLQHRRQMLRRYMKTAGVGWDTFLHTVRRLPHLRQIVIQTSGDDVSSSLRLILVEFLAHLGEAWFDLGELLGLYYRERRRSEWTQLQLDTLMDKIKQRRAEIKAEADAEKGASSTPESGDVESESTASANLQAQTSSAAAGQDSRETFQLTDGEVEILPEHIALLDEARQCQIKETKSETDAEKAASSELGSSVAAEDSEGSTHDE